MTTRTGKPDLQILCSDGLPRLTLPPTPAHPQRDIIDESAKLDENPIDTNAALEALTGANSSSSFSSSCRNNAHTYGGRSDERPTSNSNENPMARLMRLKREVHELETDLNYHHHLNEEQEMGKMVRSLVNRLDVLGQQHRRQNKNGEVLKYQQQRQIVLMQGLREAASLVGGNQTVVSDVEDNIKGLPSSSISLSSSELAQLEERIIRMEVSIGAGGSDICKGGSLLQRVHEAERILSRLDPHTLDRAATRAKIIKADLEAAAKAKLKLSSSIGSSSSAAATEDTKTIAYLHNQMTQLSEISLQLPVMAQRLGQLSALHIQSATFGNRLIAMERVSNDVEKLLGNIEEALGRVEDGCEKNLALIISNINSLDDRMTLAITNLNTSN